MKIGDRVKIIGGSSYDGMETTITGTNGAYFVVTGGLSFAPVNLQKVSHTSSSGSMVEKMVMAFKKEPEKTFIKLGVIDTDYHLTADGRIIFLSWLFKANQDKFKSEVIDPILEAEAKEKK